MKKLLLLHLLLAMFFCAQTANADVVLNSTNFPDAKFRSYISEKTGVSYGSIISDVVLTSIEGIKVSSRGISSLQGVEYFTELTYLYCDKNNLSSLDVTKNTKLITLSCSGNNFTSLDVSKNTLLEYLFCQENQLSSLDVSKNTLLKYLFCQENKLSSLDVSKDTELTHLVCYFNDLISLDVTKNTKLTYLECFGNQITSLDVTKNTELTYLRCFGNQLKSLDVTKNTKLTNLVCAHTNLTSLDVSKNTLLEELNCDGNNISSLYLSNNTELEILECSFNKINQLNLSNNTKLTTLECDGNYLTNLNLENNTVLADPDKVNVGSQSSTRSFQTTSNGSYWALYVGTANTSGIRNLKIDGESKTPTFVQNNVDGWLIVSNDLKKIPLKVEYEIYTGNEAAGWMPVEVNYDVKHYKVYVAGEELTSLNFYDIPGLKSGTAYFYDESYGIGWSGIYPTLVLYDAKIEGEKGLYNKECYDLKIIARGNNSITATDWIGFDTNPVVKTTISGGGTLWITATGDRKGGIYNSDASTLKITDGTKVICQGDGYGFFDDGGTLYIQDNSILACYGNESASVELPVESKCKFDSNIGIRYPVGAYIGNGYHVFYAGTTTDVQQDWVVFGPDNQTTQDLITSIPKVSPLEETEEGAIYNLAGQRLSKMQKGINIVGGQKVLVK